MKLRLGKASRAEVGEKAAQLHPGQISTAIERGTTYAIIQEMQGKMVSGRLEEHRSGKTSAREAKAVFDRYDHCWSSPGFAGRCAFAGDMAKE